MLFEVTPPLKKWLTSSNFSDLSRISTVSWSAVSACPASVCEIQRTTVTLHFCFRFFFELGSQHGHTTVFELITECLSQLQSRDRRSLDFICLTTHVIRGFRKKFGNLSGDFLSQRLQIHLAQVVPRALIFVRLDLWMTPDIWAL